MYHSARFFIFNFEKTTNTIIKESPVQAPKLEKTVSHTVAANARLEQNVTPSSITSKETVSTLTKAINAKSPLILRYFKQFTKEVGDIQKKAGYDSSKQALERLIKTKAERV